MTFGESAKFSRRLRALQSICELLDDPTERHEDHEGRIRDEFDLFVDEMDAYMADKSSRRQARWVQMDLGVFIDLIVDVFLRFDCLERAHRRS